jgi:predicted AAA+ superfamily ATPase
MFEILCTESDFSGINSLKVMIFIDFSPKKLISLVETRSDIGAMWENFAIAERMKQINYRHPFAQSYFWRTKQQTEIDYIEEQDGSLQAFEFKWNEHKSPRCPLSFSKAYPDASFSVVTPFNIDDYLRL